MRLLAAPDLARARLHDVRSVLVRGIGLGRTGRPGELVRQVLGGVVRAGHDLPRRHGDHTEGTSDDHLVDFRVDYYANHRGIFGVFALTIATYAVQRTLPGGGSWVRPTNLTRGAAILLLASLMVWENRRFHEVMVLVLLGLFIYFVIAF